MALITVSGLTKSYGARAVLHGVDLTVDEGEIVGVLGANGSGKTTAVECIGGLRPRDGGTINVAGMDPATDPLALREILGMQLQECRLPNKMRVSEALDLYAAFYADPRPAGELLERFGLAAHAQQPFGKLSGGQQQRLSVALALIGRPRIAFLDELTTGLDPAARRDIWEYLRLLRDDGMTMILVTHFMEEAAYLCDRVAILEGGRVVASGTPDAIATAAGGQETSFAAEDGIDLDAVGRIPGVTSVVVDRGRVVVHGDADSPQAVLVALDAQGVRTRQLRVTTPSLDDAYLALTQEGAGR
ncbi:MAG: ABC transporter ATP-binding protein [Propionibacteriaceae bacterium]|nr:ABC transporter ATP-binding protein [Propionibacteriaceae bacterium]